MNTENCDLNESNKFIYHFTDKLNLKSPNNKNTGLVNLITLRKTLNLYVTTINLKLQPQPRMMNLNCLMDHILFQTFKITFEFIIKKRETLVESPTKQIYHNKFKNKIVFKINAGYKLELLSTEIIKLLGSARKDVDKVKDGEDVPKLESVEVGSVTVIQSITVIRKHLKYYLLLYLRNNLVS